MRHQFIDAHKKAWPITLMCKVLEVSRSAYYDWLSRAPSARSQANGVLDGHIRAVYRHHKGRYGSPRITDDLQELEVPCSVNRVARRMQRMNLKAVQAKKFKVTTDSNHAKPVAPDLLAQDFTADKPNQKWVSDITYIWTTQGWLYLAVVMELYSRAIIGWSMNARMTQQLVCDALSMALFRRGFPHSVIIHSDRGSQYCSKRYQRLIALNGLQCSMGRKATCYDNAAMESFFHSLKVELVHRELYATRRQARGSIFEYIETYYNRQRKHSAIGNQIPMQFEMRKTT
jgi:transposase InsO family protein